ncbi:hypothetical protein [Phreatobacter sp.]|uniref:hypothetical protein n=1 Tax=Phreatobacter sp. TaxID=1966341 RepID=UPI0025D21F09|nr:hypothetical protein [Phreatobacter sp.]
MSKVLVEHKVDITAKIDAAIDLDLSFQFSFGSVITAAVQTLIEIAVFRSDIKKLKAAISDIYNHINKIYGLIADIQRNQIVQRDALFVIATKFEYSDRVEEYFYVLERISGDKKPSDEALNILIGTLIQNNRKLANCCVTLREEVNRRLKEISPDGTWEYFLSLHGKSLKDTNFDSRKTLGLAAQEYIRFVMLTYSNAIIAISHIPLMTNLSEDEKIDYISEIKDTLLKHVINSYDIWESWIRLYYIIWVGRVFVDNPPPGGWPPGEDVLTSDYLEVGFLELETEKAKITHNIYNTISTAYSPEYAEIEKEIKMIIDDIVRQRRESAISLVKDDVSS